MGSMLDAMKKAGVISEEIAKRAKEENEIAKEKEQSKQNKIKFDTNKFYKGVIDSIGRENESNSL